METLGLRNQNISSSLKVSKLNIKIKYSPHIGAFYSYEIFNFHFYSSLQFKKFMDKAVSNSGNIFGSFFGSGVAKHFLVETIGISNILAKLHGVAHGI